MALTVEDVARLADLARIELTEEELEHLAPQLDVILESVASVSEVADKDIPATSHAISMENVFRDDEVKLSWDPQSMLAGAPAVEDDQFLVPRILGESA